MQSDPNDASKVLSDASDYQLGESPIQEKPKPTIAERLHTVIEVLNKKTRKIQEGENLRALAATIIKRRFDCNEAAKFLKRPMPFLDNDRISLECVRLFTPITDQNAFDDFNDSIYIVFYEGTSKFRLLRPYLKENDWSIITAARTLRNLKRHGGRIIPDNYAYEKERAHLSAVGIMALPIRESEYTNACEVILSGILVMLNTLLDNISPQ